MSSFHQFPNDFLWGTATSAYQIEGAFDQDGKGPSIWDTFAHTPGKTYLGHTGDIAVDHYHRFKDDIRLMREMGLKCYRFSIAWTRILPAGRGAVNAAGLEFYDRLIDGLLENGIEPIPTLFHYDLPQALQDSGGWPNRETAAAFADYAQILSRRFSDRVTWWITHNEPWVTAFLGYFTGEHAPGIQDLGCTLAAAHHLLLSHGLAVQALRAGASRPLQIGIALNLSPVHPASDHEEDRAAARLYDGFLNRTILDPLFRKEYPQDITALAGPFFPTMEPDDMQTIAEPLDFLGVNYYTRTVVRHDPNVPFVQLSPVLPPASNYSQMWEIYPPGIAELVLRVWEDYRPGKIFLTENGVCVPDGVDFDGKVRDNRRIQYLQDHLIELHKVFDQGVPLIGYLAWSLLDNFEWAYGYDKRFGLVYVDFNSLTRTVKNSGRWFQQVIENDGFTPQMYFRDY